MGTKEAFGFGSTVFIFMSVIGVAMWVGIIWKAKQEDKLVEACKPIDWTVDALHDVTTGLVGREPTWTLKVKRYLLGGCYYFFSVMLRVGENDGESSHRGGVRN